MIGLIGDGGGVGSWTGVPFRPIADRCRDERRTCHGGRTGDNDGNRGTWQGRRDGNDGRNWQGRRDGNDGREWQGRRDNDRRDWDRNDQRGRDQWRRDNQRRFGDWRDNQRYRQGWDDRRAWNGRVRRGRAR